MIIFFVVAIILLTIYETLICIKRKYNRRHTFKLAKARSDATRLPLLVIGDPYNGLASIVTGSDYGCGDICVDMCGCKCDNSVKDKLENFIQKINVNDYIIFISCVLEYVDDLPLILSYLTNMNPDNLFIVSVESYCLMSRFYPCFLTKEQPPKYIIYDAPPNSNTIIYQII